MAAPKIAPQQRPALSTVLKRAYLWVALVAVGLAGISMTLGGLLAMSRIAEHNLQLLGRSLSYTVEAAVMFRDPEAAQEAINLVASTEEISFIEVSDRDGNLLAEWQADVGVLSDVEQWIADLFLPAGMEFPISSDGMTIGSVSLRGSGSSLVSFLVIGVLAIFASLLLSVVCAFFLSRRILQGIIGPLEQLTMVAHKIRDERAFDRRLPSAAIAELDGLSQDFNELIEELGGWESRWREENAQLHHKTRHDSLTGLNNRAFFENELRNATRGEHKFALLYIDGDNFKTDQRQPWALEWGRRAD